MSITGILGTGGSYLGGIVLGSGDGGFPVYSVGASNTLTLSQSVSVSVTYNLHPSNTLTINQLAGRAYVPTASNTLTLSQSATDVLIPNTSVSQTLTLTQSATATKVLSTTASNTLTMTQAAAGNAVLNLAASSTLTLTSLTVHVFVETASNTLTLTQAVAVVKWKNVIASNALVLTQTVAPSLTIKPDIHQGLVLTQLVSRTVSFNRPLTTSLTLTQTAVAVATKAAFSTLTLTQDAVCLLGKRAKNDLVLTQSMGRLLTSNRSMHSNLIPFQTLVVNTTLRRSISDTLTLAHTVAVQVVRPVANTLFLTQEATSYVAKPAFSTLNLVSIGRTNYTLNPGPASEVLLSQQVTLEHSKSRSATNVVAFNQNARGTLLRTAVASNVLVLTNDVVRERFNRSVTHTLGSGLFQSAVANKYSTRSAQNTLNLSQSVSVSKTYLRSASNTLVFQTGFQKYVGFANYQFVFVPTVQVVKVRRITVLQSSSASIVLPTPEFNDREGATGKLNIKRSMNGVRRVYKRESPTSRLTYEFVMDRMKAIELRAFILVNNSAVLRMENWKGELWAVQLVNNPFTFKEESRWEGSWGNRSSITLEFEGVRLN